MKVSAQLQRDGPFYPDSSLPPRERRKKLREEVYSTMCERAKSSNVEWIKYLPAEAQADTAMKEEDL